MGLKRKIYFAYMDSSKYLYKSFYNLHKKIQSMLRPTSIEVNGYHMLLDKGDSTGYSTREYEKETTKWIKQQIKPGDVVIDVGANIGYYTLLFAKIVGEKGKVFAFEPEQKNFNLLKRNVELNNFRNVVLIKKAVTDKNGKGNLYLDPVYIGSHVMYNEFTGKKPIEVETTTLDDYFRDYKGKIDFIKMDIEGSEMNAIRGGKELIKKIMLK